MCCSHQHRHCYITIDAGIGSFNALRKSYGRIGPACSAEEERQSALLTTQNHNYEQRYTSNHDNNNDEAQTTITTVRRTVLITAATMMTMTVGVRIVIATRLRQVSQPLPDTS